MADVASLINLSAQATWPITFGESIKATKRAASLTSVRYNHLPKLNDRSTVAQSIRPSESKEGCEASIKDGEQEWRYTGARGKATDNYVLVLSENGGRKKATLERIDTTVALNIITTPDELDTAKLQQRYQQLSVANEDNHDEPGTLDHSENGTPDADNPFDYRHFLEEPSPKQTSQIGVSKSHASTPVVRPASQTTKTSAAPVVKKRKPATESTQPAAKRTKATQPALPRAKTSVPDNVPAVRLERKATMPLPQADDDDGELILENDDDAPHGKHQSAMSMALSGSLGSQIGHGPISLQSAASSPASRLHSPAVEGPEDAEEFELGGDDDADVEHFGLPSPVHAPNSTIQAAAVEEDDDDDDDLEKQLAEAMGQDDAAPEEEESEEE
ncbi:hypothetical protein AMS68_003399 [Peltaster fructicola]|uniref:Transcription elongation factor Eaf N-terminal domain-containing protein n=1 Tax=Peltaster fructicola TaxID=286661 RepID=A0A6H0XSY3_9PEZI|nr:hypothetical protein AMS68_003399 [Peltaster fructicola]